MLFFDWKTIKIYETAVINHTFSKRMYIGAIFIRRKIDRYVLLGLFFIESNDKSQRKVMYLHNNQGEQDFEKDIVFFGNTATTLSLHYRQ